MFFDSNSDTGDVGSDFYNTGIHSVLNFDISDKKTDKKHIQRNSKVYHGNPDNFKIDEKILDLFRCEDGYEDVPEKLEIKYKNDCDILWVNKKIVIYFNLMSKKLPKLKNELKFQEELKNKSLTKVDISHFDGKIEDLKKNIYEIENKVKLREYIKESSPILAQYDNLDLGDSIVNFGKTTEEDQEEDELKEYKKSLINQYLKIASKYYDLDIRKEVDPTYTCPICFHELDEELNKKEGIIECLNCNYQDIYYTNESMFKDTSRVESDKSKEYYQDRKNFQKTCYEFFAIQINKLPDDIYTNLDRYCISYNLPTSDVIKKMPLRNNMRGPWENQNEGRLFLYRMLKATGYSDYYKDERLILYNYWGWPKPSGSSICKKFMDDYDLTHAAYVKIENKERKSSLNTQYSLFRIAQANNYCLLPGVRCTIDDFRVVQTPKIIKEHDELWFEMCDISGYPKIMKYWN